jgi:hypothetical protein
MAQRAADGYFLLVKALRPAGAFDEAWRACGQKDVGRTLLPATGRNRIVRAADSRTIA